MASSVSDILEKQIEGCGFKPDTQKGSGTYGVVWGVIDTNNKSWAYKYIKPYQYEKYGLSSLNEVDIASRLNHPHLGHIHKLLTPRDCKIEGVAILLVNGDQGNLMEMAAYKTSYSYNHQKLKILYQLATGLAFMHQNNILHLDIKLENVILKGRNYHPYLIDFGLSIQVDDASVGFTYDSYLVTVKYRAPEILRGSKIYNAAVDVWAFGILAYYLLTGEEYHNIRGLSKDTPDVHKLLLDRLNVFENRRFYRDKFSRLSFKDLNMEVNFLMAILRLDPTKRLTAAEIVEHPIFDSIRYPINGIMLESKMFSYDYTSDHQHFVNNIIDWAPKIYENKRSEMLFLAIDLFTRTDYFFLDRNRKTVAATCLWLGYKLSTLYLADISKLTSEIPDIKSEDILECEIDIVKLLQGYLNSSNLYRHCKDGIELAISFKYVIGYQQIDHNPNLYSDTNIPDWISYIRSPDRIWKGSDIPRNKDLSISELYSLASNIELVI